MDPTPAIRASYPRDPAFLPLILLAVLARILWATSSPIINADAYFYLDTAEVWRTQGTSPALRQWLLHPLYPGCIRILRAVVPDPWVCGAAVSILSGALALAALYALVRDGWGRGTAACTAFLYALHPGFGEMESKVLSQGLYHACALGSILFLWKALGQGSWRLALLAGGCLGAAYLTRAEGIILGLATTAVASIACLLPAFRRRWWVVPAMALTAALVALPYLLWLRGEYGRWIPSPRGAARQVLEEESTLPRAPGQAAAGRVIPAVVGELAWQTFKAFHYVPAGLALIGLALFRRGSGGKGAGRLLTGTAVGILGIFVVYGLRGGTELSVRYLSLPALLLLPLAGWGFWNSALRLSRPPLGRPAAATGFGLLIAIVLVVRTLNDHSNRESGIVEAMTWLRANGAKGKAMMSSLDAMAYHSEAKLVRIRQPDLILRSVRGAEVDLLVYEEQKLTRWPPDLREQILGSPGVRLLNHFGPPGSGVVIYTTQPGSRPN